MIPVFKTYDYVLVRGHDRKITGIITASDLSVQFQGWTEPFLVLSEIENLLRNMIGERFQASELVVAGNPGIKDKKINSVADLAFGEYVRLLENPAAWKKFNVSVDRATFCETLAIVRQIRNDVMHFHPGGISENDVNIIRNFVRVLKQIVTINGSLESSPVQQTKPAPTPLP